MRIIYRYYNGPKIVLTDIVGKRHPIAFNAI